jgi:hypothetical protein
MFIGERKILSKIILFQDHSLEKKMRIQIKRIISLSKKKAGILSSVIFLSFHYKKMQNGTK